MWVEKKLTMARRQKKTKPKSGRSSGKSNTLRIIGGQWRSRKLSFSDAEGLRPTPDRVRETLFNWLQNDIHGAICLDLFAGSGALGFEALSRGAGHVTFVEKDRTVADQLESNISVLKILSASAEVLQGDALEYLQKIAEKGGGVLDIIFLDPPYRKNMIQKSLSLLQEKSLITSNTLIYLEHESEETFDESAYGLNILKETNAGQVKCYLLQNKIKN